MSLQQRTAKFEAQHGAPERYAPSNNQERQILRRHDKRTAELHLALAFLRRRIFALCRLFCQPDKFEPVLKNEALRPYCTNVATALRKMRNRRGCLRSERLFQAPCGSHEPPGSNSQPES